MKQYKYMILDIMSGRVFAATLKENLIVGQTLGNYKGKPSMKVIGKLIKG